MDCALALSVIVGLAFVTVRMMSMGTPPTVTRTAETDTAAVLTASPLPAPDAADVKLLDASTGLRIAWFAISMDLEPLPGTGHIASAREAAFMPATRRRLLTASIGLAMPAIPAAEAAPRSVTFAAYGGLFQDLYEPAVVDPFSRAHPDIGVFYDAVSSATQALALLRRQRELPETDVVLLDLASARTATEEGLLEPLTCGIDAGSGGTRAGQPFRRRRRPGVVHRAAGDAVRCRPGAAGTGNWKTLWARMDERSIAIPAPPDSVGIAFTLVAGRLFGGGCRAARGPGWHHRDQRPLAPGHNLGSHARRLSLHRRRRCQMGVGWNMPAQVNSDRTGGRLGVVFPEEGTLSRVTTVNLVKGSRQPEAARQFIAWLLGADAQRTMVEQMFLGPVNAKARYTEGALAAHRQHEERAARCHAGRLGRCRFDTERYHSSVGARSIPDAG